MGAETLHQSVVAPVAEKERHHVLDALRGFAVLGILLMNIHGLAMHYSSYDSPLAFGGSTGWNMKTWWLEFLFVEGKLRSLFAVMFGASVVLLTSRLEERGAETAEVYYRRNLWLMAFGLMHGWLFWYGDVLYMYGLAALALFPFRKLKAKTLLLIALSLVTLNTAGYISNVHSMKKNLNNEREALRIYAEGGFLTEKQETLVEALQENRLELKPTPERIEKDLKIWRNSFWNVTQTRMQYTFVNHQHPYYTRLFGVVWSLMFLGMALFKYGVLTGERSKWFYAWLGILGCGVGLSLATWVARQYVKTSFSVDGASYIRVLAEPARLLVALGYVGFFMLLFKSGAVKWLMSALSAAGRMAMSNYIIQSIIGSFLFCGYGFGLYGKLQRYQLALIALGIALFQLIMSPIWFKYFRFGPFEYVWRSLTYLKRPAFRRQPKAVSP